MVDALEARAHERGWKEPLVDEHGAQGRPEAPVGDPPVEAGRQSDIGILERRHYRPEIVATDADVAVGHHEYVVLRGFVEIGEVAHLRIRADRAIADDETQIR